MPKNAIKREGRVNFWKNIDYKKPETRPEPVMSNPNPTRTRRNISKPDPTRTRKKFQNPNPTRTRHLATRPITISHLYFKINIVYCNFLTVLTYPLRRENGTKHRSIVHVLKAAFPKLNVDLFLLEWHTQPL